MIAELVRYRRFGMTGLLILAGSTGMQAGEAPKRSQVPTPAIWREEFDAALPDGPTEYAPNPRASVPSAPAQLAGPPANTDETAASVDSAVPAAGPETPIAGEEVVRERHPNGKIRVERHVVQDAADNFVNHGTWVMFNLRGQETARGEYKLGKRHGLWVRTHVALGELHLTLPPGAEQFTPPFISIAQFADGQLHGPWSLTDSKNRKIVLLNYESGKRDGRSEWFYPNGSLWREIEYREGLRDGQMTEWNANRTVAARFRYIDGQRIVKQTEWHSKDVKKLETSYLQVPEFAGTVDDWWTATSRELPIEIQRKGAAPSAPLPAVLGIRHGEVKGWHANGQPALIGWFDKDQPAGQFKWWHANGQQACVGEYEYGHPSGMWVWWHVNGLKKSQGEFGVGGLQQGKWLWWDNQGHVAKSATFDDKNTGLQIVLRPEGLQPPQVDVDPASPSQERPTAQSRLKRSR